MAAFGLVSSFARLHQRNWGLASAALVGLVASSLAGAGIDGVQRWQRLGSLQVHPSALLSPCILVAATVLAPKRERLASVLLLATQIVHVLQPDAGQATAFAMAALTASWLRGAQQRLVGIVLLGGAALAWCRPDPLPPAPYVEDIVHRAFQVHPSIGLASLASLLLFVAAPFLIARPPSSSLAPRLALGAYFAGTALVPLFGEFPVPLLGYGPSPLVGAFLGLALLRAVESPARVSSAEGRPHERLDDRFNNWFRTST
jgi:cell division protein FtsW (lipid II flippase)